MRHQKKKSGVAKAASLKVDAQVRDRIRTVVKRQGMTVTGAFRRYEAQIVAVLEGASTTAA